MLAEDSTSSSVIKLVRDFSLNLPASDTEARDIVLMEAGLTSSAAVHLLFALEAALNIAIPDKELTVENFRTIRSIEALVSRLSVS